MTPVALIVRIAAPAAVALLAACTSHPAPSPAPATPPPATQPQPAPMTDTTQALKAIYPDLQGMHRDEKTGETVLTVLATGHSTAVLQEKRAAAEKVLGTPVRIVTIDAPLREQ